MTTPVTTSNGTNNQPDQSQQQSTKEDNLVQMRKALEQANQARHLAEQRLLEIEKVAQERIKATTVQHDDEDDDEPYVDKKRLNKRLVNFKKEQDEEIEKRVTQKVTQVIEEDRRAGYLRQNPDFQKVMSSDLVQRFADEHKDLAENILQMPEGFERQKLVYQTIKTLGLDKPATKQPSIQEKMDANRRSPFMPNPGSNAPGYQTVGDFSDIGQKNAYQQMKNLQKRIYGNV